jgi:protein tyrosine phosphatase (PTP) superfamily phosphohydrolase (DUF442 family)
VTRRAALVVLCGAALLGVGVPLRARLVDTNLHEVLPGRVFRSAQPDSDTLATWIDSLDLRAVVNLRGARPDRAWHRGEREVTRARGVALHDLRLSGDRLPSRQELRELVALLDTAERPLLLHCKDGTDRSGLAAALVRLLAGESLARAREEFSLRYGHLGALHPTDHALWLDDYARWLRDAGRDHSPALLRRYVRDGYVPYFYAAAIEPVQTPSRVTRGEPSRVALRVTNRSPRPWRFTEVSERGVHLGARISGPAPGRDQVLETRGRTPARELGPGEALELDLVLPPLSRPGRYDVLVDLVDEGVTWFAAMGSPPLRLELEVVEPGEPNASVASAS